MIKKDCRGDWDSDEFTVDLWPSSTFVWGISDKATLSSTYEDVVAPPQVFDVLSEQAFAWAKSDTTSFREVRSEGSYYRICWCAWGYDCADGSKFVVDAGTMKLIGPHFDQHKTCVSGAECRIGGDPGVTGVGLADGDRTMILRYCDTDLYVARFPNFGLSDPATATQDGYITREMLSWNEEGQIPITSPGGLYKMCWCAATQTCTRSGRNFRVEYGTLYVLGPSPLTQSWSCISGEFCNVSTFTGFGLGDGDRMMISHECGNAAPSAIIDRWPGSGISMEATTEGTAFNWNNYITAGVYTRMYTPNTYIHNNICTQMRIYT